MQKHLFNCIYLDLVYLKKYVENLWVTNQTSENSLKN